MRVAAGMLVAVSACYSPTVPAGAPCDLALDNCPAGQRCEMTPSGPFCGAVPVQLDAMMQGSDGPRPDMAPGCLGTGLVTNVCLMPPPMTDVIVAANRTINTAMVGGGNCDQIVAQPMGGPSLCLVAGRSITIQSGAKLIGIGPNPLLLVSTSTITVAGTIDVASHVTGNTMGAGAEMSCTGPTGGNGSGGGAGAGGAGGTFSTAGGNGGNGRNGGSGGQAIGPMTPGTVRGGCAGGNGGTGGGGGGAGNGGPGGGAVYLIAAMSISISGTINASGAAGNGGADAANAGSGGGGGGSGGMVGLDAPAMTVTGSVFANGGGGGGGNGDMFDRHGSDGNEAMTADTQANGGSGGAGGGGNGGKGFAGALQATSGGNGGALYCAGGGGGGGAGVIKVYGVAPSSLGGTVSPPAT